MPAEFVFVYRIEFSPEDSDALLRAIPAAPGVLALRGADPASEPYLTRTADLRRRARRLLALPEAKNEDGTPTLSKRLNLRDRVRSVVTMLLVSLVVEKPRMVLAVPVCRMMSEMDGSK